MSNDKRITHRGGRRRFVQAGLAGGVGLLSEGSRLFAGQSTSDRSQRACIYIFLSGGLAQHDTFDMKPDAPEEIRGDFKPVQTSTPGLFVCEHLPMLAARSKLWSLCRSMTHSSNEHSAGHHIMLTGRSDLPPQFRPNKPAPGDWPSIAAVAGALTKSANGLPTSAILPERLVHNSGRVIPGQFAAMMGSRREPWFIEASPFHPLSYGAYPEYAFDHQERGKPDDRVFQAPSLTLPEGLSRQRLRDRLALLHRFDNGRPDLAKSPTVQRMQRLRGGALSLLTDSRVHRALDVTNANEADQDRYGKNCFGWSVLMARRLVDVGVRFVQVNLGNDETWDTHGNAFPHLKEKLLPPTDRALSALLDDLNESNRLDDTLVVMAGEFGRTPKISLLPKHYKKPGRDHWGAVQSVLLAGGGVPGGAVVGSSDKIGAYPQTEPQRPENLAATIYHALGIPRGASWFDELDRPHFVYHADPMTGLL